MPMQFILSGSDLGKDKVRLGEMAGLVESGDGTVGIGGLEFDDPAGTLTVNPLLDFHVDETDATPTRLWSGYVADRKISHAASTSLITGAARRWDTTLVDLNAVAEFKVITGSDGNRPQETDVARITWLLGSNYFTLVHDHGLIDVTGPVTLDAADYRGKKPRDVLDDCMSFSGKVWFLTFDDASGDTTLAYFNATTSSLFTSSARLTDDRDDVDQSTTFYVRRHPGLTKDPSQLYQGAYIQWTGGTTYLENPIPGVVSRDIAIDAPQIGRESSAIALATKTLAEAATETDTINCVVPMPKEHVNDIRAGQRIQVKFEELPGYTTYTYVRVVRRTISQLQTTEDFYDVALELKNTKTIVTTGGGTAPGGETPGGGEPPPAEPCLSDSGDVIVWNIEPHNDGPAPRDWLIYYQHFGMTFTYDSVGIANGCAPGNVRYDGTSVPGWTQRYSGGGITSIPASAVALRFTMTIVRDTSTYGGFTCYLTQAVPQAWDDGIHILTGEADQGSGTTFTVDVPADLLTTGPVWLNFAGIRPTVGSFCGAPAMLLYDPPPLDAYWYGVPYPSTAWVSICPDSVGIIDWLPGHGAIDGANRTYIIDGWDGTGIVEASVNGLAAPIASTDDVALTVTLVTPPPPLAIVMFRYSTGAA